LDIRSEINRRFLQITRKLSDATDDVRHEVRTRICLKFCHQSRFEEGQLLKPNGIPDDQIQLFESNLNRPGVGRHGFTDDLTPSMLQAKFNQSRFQSEALGQTGQNSAERIECAGASHAAS